jgi:hypothetical protein
VQWAYLYYGIAGDRKPLSGAPDNFLPDSSRNDLKSACRRPADSVTIFNYYIMPNMTY